MTREEAIRFLENMSIYQQPDSDYRNALDMAIKALENQPKFIIHSDGTMEQIIEPCEDCISRAEAIKAMEDKAKGLKNLDTINGLCGAVAILFDLPSVQPKPKTSTWNHGIPDVINEYIITVRERWGKDEEWKYETLGAWYTQDGWELSYDLDEGQEWEIIAWMPLPEPYKADMRESEGSDEDSN